MDTVYIVTKQSFISVNGYDTACGVDHNDVVSFKTLESAVAYVEEFVKQIEAATGIKFLVTDYEVPEDIKFLSQCVRTYAQDRYSVTGVRETYRISKQTLFY